jgi:hypothetical protein
LRRKSVSKIGSETEATDQGVEANDVSGFGVEIKPWHVHHETPSDSPLDPPTQHPFAYRQLSIGLAVIFHR